MVAAPARFRPPHALQDGFQLDVVTGIATPPEMHTEHMLIGAKHRKHVIVEKPMALSIDDAEKMNVLAKVKVCEPPKTAEWVRGKILFNTAMT